MEPGTPMQRRALILRCEALDGEKYIFNFIIIFESSVYLLTCRQNEERFGDVSKFILSYCLPLNLLLGATLCPHRTQVDVVKAGLLQF